MDFYYGIAVKMLTILLGLCVVTSAFAGILPPEDGGRIINGEETTIEKFPHQVSLQSYSVHICGGSILNEKYIITAAHCTDGKKAENLKIRAGSTNKDRYGSLVKVEKIIQHEKYNRINKDNDISLLKLVEPLTFSQSIKAIKLVKTHPPAGTVATVSGWGRTIDGNSSSGPDNLRFVDITVIDIETCRSKYPDNPVTDRMFCCFTEGKDSCQGDSGGPLIANGVQIGVVSWGFGCGKKYPGVYTKLTEELDWIQKNAQ